MNGPPSATAPAPQPAGFLLACFTTFNTLRVLSYLPTMRAIQASGDSSQHSLLTWFVWCGANLTMALYLLRQERRLSRAVLMNFANAGMCLATMGLIVWHRF